MVIKQEQRSDLCLARGSNFQAAWCFLSLDFKSTATMLIIWYI